MYCQNCGTENTGVVCTNCGANLQNSSPKVKTKKPVFKQWWFWVIVVVALIAVIGVFGGNDEGETGKGGIGSVSIDSSNVVENVAEYSINRVFVAEKIEALLESSLSYVPGSGNEFIVIDTNVKNLASTDISIDDTITMTLDVNGTKVNAKSYIVTDSDVSAYGSISALAEERVYFAVEVPMGTNPENMSLTVKCGEKTASTTISASQFESKKQYVTLGKEYSKEDVMSVTFEKTFFSQRIEPPRTNGVYSYYEAENGKTYLVVKMHIENLKGNPLDIDEIVGIKAVFDGKYKYDGFMCVETDNGSDLDSYGEIEPLDSTNGYYLIEVPESVQEKSAELEIYLLGENYYYTVK